MKLITSTQHTIVKHLVKLREKREYRSACRSALLPGIKLIKELSGAHRFKTVLIETGYSVDFPIQAEQIFYVNAAIMKKATGLNQPEPLAAEIALPLEQDVSKIKQLLVLDGISDPGNMGTLLRTALALGWQGVLITPGSTDPFNEKALRSAKGATFKIPIQCASSWSEVETFFASSPHFLIAADVRGEPMEQMRIQTPIALALGNEASGLSAYIKERARPICIPMEQSMESLNVASAGAILMQFLKGR
jgi:RNA methyltransferase, TrmH family